MAEVQNKLQTLSDEFQKLQSGQGLRRFTVVIAITNLLTAATTELQSTIEARQKLESQQQENKGVQKVAILSGAVLRQGAEV